MTSRHECNNKEHCKKYWSEDTPLNLWIISHLDNLLSLKKIKSNSELVNKRYSTRRPKSNFSQAPHDSECTPEGASVQKVAISITLRVNKTTKCHRKPIPVSADLTFSRLVSTSQALEWINLEGHSTLKT